MVLGVVYEVTLANNLPANEFGVAPAAVRPNRLSRCRSFILGRCFVLYARSYMALLMKLSKNIPGRVRADAVLILVSNKYRIRSYTAE